LFSGTILDFGKFRANEARIKFIEFRNTNRIDLLVKDIRSTIKQVQILEIHKKYKSGLWDILNLTKFEDVTVCAQCLIRVMIRLHSEQEGHFDFQVQFKTEKVKLNWHKY